jgi:hypothetical protein
MASYGYTATGSAAASANIATDKVRISTITPVHVVSSYPNVSGTGTITTSVSNANVTGSGTAFLSELKPGFWIGNATGVTVGIIQTIANNTFATLTANGNVAIAGAGFKINPYGVPYVIATANSEIIPGNTVVNSFYVGQGNIVSYLNPSGVTANVFTVTELGMPHANSGASGFGSGQQT